MKYSEFLYNLHLAYQEFNIYDSAFNKGNAFICIVMDGANVLEEGYVNKYFFRNTGTYVNQWEDHCVKLREEIDNVIAYYGTSFSSSLFRMKHKPIPYESDDHYKTSNLLREEWLAAEYKEQDKIGN